MTRAERRQRLLDRLVLWLGLVATAGLGLLAWFAQVREATSTPVRAALLLATLAAAAATLLRRRVYPVLPPARLVALALGVSLPVLAVEVVANLTNPRGYLYFAECQRYFAWMRRDGVTQVYRHPASSRLVFPWGTVTTNQDGFRGPDVSPRPAPGTLRVLALGDSFCFSWGVDDDRTVCRELERALPARLAGRGWDRVEVVNTGHGSWSSIDQLLTLEARGFDLQPHVALLLVCSNDFVDRPAYEDQVQDCRRRNGADLIGPLAATAIPRPRTRPGPVYSAVSHLLQRSFLIVEGAAALEAWQRPPGGPAAPPGPVLAVTPSLQPLAEDEPGWPYLRESGAAVREIARRCKNARLPLLILVLAPAAPSTVNPAPAEYRLAQWLAAKVGDRAPVKPLAWPLVDPGRYANSPTDGHWNPMGTKHFAGLIADDLAPLVPAAPAR